MINFNEDILVRLESYLSKAVRRAINSYINSSVTAEEKRLELSNTDIVVKLVSQTHDEGDPQDFVSNSETCWNHTKFELQLINNGVASSYVGSLSIPYMLDGGIFIIDGKIRVSTNVLSTNYDCSYNPNDRKFQLNGVSYMINPSGVITATYYSNGNKVVDVIRNAQEFDNLTSINTSINEVQREKINYLLDVKYSEKDTLVPNNLSYDFLLSIPKYEVVNTRRDSVATLRIQNAIESLMQYLNSKAVIKQIVSSIKSGIFTNTKTPTFACSALMKPTMKFLRLSNGAGVDIATVVNPLVFDQLHNKLKMPNYMPYTYQLRDIIDAPNTPENNNVNVINELNVCIFHNDKVGIGIHTYHYPSGEKVDVRYNTYINEYSLHYSEWDYENNELRDPNKSEYLVNYHTITSKISANDLHLVKFIEPKLDDKFSLSSRNIPFLNCSDHVRVAMATGMLKQSVELETPEEPLVSSGNTNIDSSKSTLNTYAIEDGIIEDHDGVRGIKYDSGRFQAFPKAISGMNHTTITHDELVNVGDKVTKGQKLTSAYSAAKGYDLGTNALVFYINYLGKTFEDGQVVSQSFADRLAHWTIQDVIVNIYEGESIESLIDFGSKVNSSDILVKTTSNRRSIEGKARGTSKVDQVNNLLTNITKVPNNITDGIIIDADFSEDPNSKLGNNGIVIDFINNKKKLSDDRLANIELVPKRLRTQRFNTSAWVKPSKTENIIARVRYKIAVRRPVVIGDKLCNRYGSKGMISLILPDNCMPYYINDNDEKIVADIVVNPASIVARKNVSQLHEALLSRCIDKIYSIAKNAKTEEEKLNALELVKKYYPTQHKDLTMDGLDAMIKSGKNAFTMHVGTFVENAYDLVMNMANELNVSDSEYVYAPSVSIRENNEFDADSHNIGMEVKLIEDKDGNIDESLGFKDGTNYSLGWLDAPALVGVNYYLKLYHSAVWSGSTTGALPDKAKSPLLGKGKARKTGQVIGEMESWALKSTGAESLIQDKNYSPSYEKSQWDLIASYMRCGIQLTK